MNAGSVLVFENLPSLSDADRDVVNCHLLGNDPL